MRGGFVGRGWSGYDGWVWAREIRGRGTALGDAGCGGGVACGICKVGMDNGVVAFWLCRSAGYVNVSYQPQTDKSEALQRTIYQLAFCTGGSPRYTRWADFDGARGTSAQNNHYVTDVHQTP